MAAVVLSAVNSARSGARAAAIQSSLRSAIIPAQQYFLQHGSYRLNANNSVCEDTEIQKIIDSIRDTGALVDCYVREGSTLINLDLQRKDWAISVYLNENNMFSVNHEGVVKFDGGDTVGADVGESWTRTNWNNAMDACSVLGKRLPSLSQLAALEEAWYNEHSTRPVAGGTLNAFTAGVYWSSSSVAGPIPPQAAWRVPFNDGGVTNYSVTSDGFVRCVS